MDSSGPPEYRALNTEEILEIILNNLKTPDLLRCRMVNKKWNKEATSILKRRPVYLKAIIGIAKEYNELFSVMKNSVDFPFYGFGFTLDSPLTWMNKRKSVDTVAARRFFGKFGSHFHYLHLRSAFIRTPDLVPLLSSFLPNTRVIELGTDSIQHINEEGLKSMNLPALRVIKIQAPRGFARGDLIAESDFTALLRAATNLEKIEGDLITTEDNEGILRAISATKNWDKVSNLALECHARVNPSVYQGLTLNAPSALTQLTVDVPSTEEEGRMRISTEFAECVRAVLLSSAETLRSLVIGRITLPMHQLPIIFPKLKTLVFQQKVENLIIWPYMYLVEPDDEENINNAISNTMVSPGISNHCEKFPAVSEIRLNVQYVALGQLREKFWGKGTVWNSVLKLDFLCEVSPGGIKHLSNVFPSVTHVVIHFPLFFGRNKETLSRIVHLRGFRALQKLEILDIGRRPFEFHLDELLTGLPLSVCHKLRGSPKQKPCEESNEIIRPLGGVVRLRGTSLSELVLYLKHGSSWNKDKGDPLISEASICYGLEMMPGLRTVLKVPNKAEDFAATLPEAVKKFVTIINM